jgi:dTDP-glucose 4,6-dehydratase
MGKEAKTELVSFHEHNPGHDLHYGLDGFKLNALGWRPPLKFEDSLKQMIDWQTAHPEWLK